MKIRHVEERDLDDILRINEQEAKWVGSRERSFFKKYLGLPFFQVVEEAGKIVGFVLAMREDTDYDSKNFLWFKERVDKFLYVDRLVIDVGERGKGLGSELYKKIIAESGVSITAEITIIPMNRRSIGFHERFGFQGMGEFSADGEKVCRMYKLDN